MNAREYLHKTARERAFILDGGMGTLIQSAGLSADDFGGSQLEGANDWLSVTRPDLIGEIHSTYLLAGSDAVETNSFGSTRPKMAEWHLEEHMERQNLASAGLARQAADAAQQADGRRRLVFASLGPSGFLPSASDPSLSHIELPVLRGYYKEQALLLQQGGADVFLVETGQDILEVKLAVLGILDALHELGVRDQHAIIAQITLDTSGKMLLGTDIEAAMVTLTGLDVDGIGLNCSTGPAHMRDPVRYLCGHVPSDFLISVVPNAGLPRNEGGQAVYPESPQELSAALAEFVDLGVNIVGGCCGTTPEHIGALVAAVRGKQPLPRSIERSFMVSGSLSANELLDENRPFLIGERLNAQGSRKVKELLLAEDWDALVDLAQGQVDTGAHLLDLCCALNETDRESGQMLRLMHDVAMTVPLPMVIDTTEEEVAKLALQALPGRGLLNSLHLESGRAKMDALLPALAEVGAGFVAMTIDEEGMARTAQRKLAVARKIYDIAVGEYGFLPGALFYDCLTFTLATGEDEYRQSAKETIEAIALIKKELPGVRTTLGVSNVSFGLAPGIRPVLNSVFLYHAVRAGLDTAIIHPASVLPYPEISSNLREAAEDLIFARREDALERLIAAGEGFEGRSAKQEKRSYQGLERAEEVHQRILFRDPDGMIDALEELRQDRSAVDIINHVLLPAMKDVGDRFGSGELILPFVLKSAEVMKKSVAHLEQFLEKSDSVSKGKILLATVYGDVHDIGKNLVGTILSNNGYEVTDLGKQVPVDRIVDQAREIGVDAIGLSALLVSTSKQMPIVVRTLSEQDHQPPILIGGAAINRNFGYRMNRIQDDDLYTSGVYYCKDAFEGLATLNRMYDEGSESVLTELHDKMHRFEQRQAVGEVAPTEQVSQRSAIRPVSGLDQPPVTGAQTVTDVPAQELFPLMEDSGLYKVQWGVRAKNKEDFARLMEEEFLPQRRRFEQRIVEQNLLQPAVRYGYFPVHVEDDGFVFDVQGQSLRMALPRQKADPWLCLSDYFADGQLVPLFVSTVGSRILEETDRLQKEDNYSDSFLLHGMAMELAEALAEWTHRRIRSELGLADAQGKRYSPGYPACPDLELQKVFFALLTPDVIGLQLTTANQIVPEASVSAIVVPHPDSTYFNVK